MPKRLLIVEDNIDTARRFAFSVSGVSSLSLVATVRTVAEAKSFLRSQGADVVLVDLGLPDGSGLEVIRLAASLSPPPLVLVCSAFGDEANVVASIEAGAQGYVLKDELTSPVVAEIEKLIEGGSTLSPAIAKLLLKRFRSQLPQPIPQSETVHLTGRETELLSLIARGCSYAEAADVVGITVDTVGVHLRNSYKKLSVHSKNEAVYEATRLGLLRVS